MGQMLRALHVRYGDRTVVLARAINPVVLLLSEPGWIRMDRPVIQTARGDLQGRLDREFGWPERYGP